MTDAKLWQAISRLRKLRDQEKQIHERASGIQAMIVDELQNRDEVAMENADLRISLVRPEKMTWDIESLRRLLPKSKFAKVTKIVIDQKAIESEVQKGEIPVDIVASASEIESLKPYVRIGHSK